MIVLDTNVVSEAMREAGNARVRNWLDQQRGDAMYLAAPSLAELLLGVELLPAGKRKAWLSMMLRQELDRRFAFRVLPFDQKAAEIYATLVKRARAGGVTISIMDGQIAAIAAANGFAVATRDTGPFIASDIPVINPWEHGASAP